MRVHHTGICLAIIGALAFASAAFAGTQTTDWPVYRANAIGYYQSRLPSAIVIYVYASSNDLIGIINPHGHSDPGSMQNLKRQIANKKFTRLGKAKRASMEKSLKVFLLDQGYRTSNMVDSKSKYTLLLTMPKVKRSDCAAYLDVENKFKKAIRDSIPQDDNGYPLYSVAILELDSPKSRISCTN